MSFGEVVCYLSKNADGFRVSSRVEEDGALMKEALECKTHLEALAVLKKIEDNGAFLCTMFILQTASSREGMAHECSGDRIVRFVREKIDVFQLQSRREIDRHLAEAGARGGVTRWGKSIICCGNQQIDLALLSNHIDRLEEDETAALLTKMRKYRDDASTQSQRQGTVTKALFYLRNTDYSGSGKNTSTVAVL